MEGSSILMFVCDGTNHNPIELVIRYVNVSEGLYLRSDRGKGMTLNPKDSVEGFRSMKSKGKDEMSHAGGVTGYGRVCFLHSLTTLVPKPVLVPTVITPEPLLSGPDISHIVPRRTPRTLEERRTDGPPLRTTPNPVRSQVPGEEIMRDKHKTVTDSKRGVHFGCLLFEALDFPRFDH